jgi:carbon-monoxide dehydrogenase small subunit
MTRVAVEVNGSPCAADVEPRLLLADFLRDHLGLTGTHIGCEQGVCGTCTVHIDGKPARSCLTLAVQVDGAAIQTVEGLAPADSGALHPLQVEFREHHALQCGYCTPGFLMSMEPLLPGLRGASSSEVREQLAGNLCRCTGYENIVDATQAAVAALAGGSARRVSVEVERELPANRERALAAATDPLRLLRVLGIAEPAGCGLTGARGRLRAGATTIEGVLELIDVDHDDCVVNLAIEARDTGGPGRASGSLTIAHGAAWLLVTLDLHLVGMPGAPPEAVEARLRRAAEAWIDSLGR